MFTGECVVGPQIGEETRFDDVASNGASPIDW